jgi:hypothetical protein
MMEKSITLLALAFTLAVAFQTYELVREQQNLDLVFTGQDASVQQAFDVRQETDALAGEVAQLGDRGNPNAQTAVAELGRQGITLRTPPATPAPAPTAPAAP